MRAGGSVETDIKGIPSNSMFVIKHPVKITQLLDSYRFSLSF